MNCCCLTAGLGWILLTAHRNCIVISGGKAEINGKHFINLELGGSLTTYYQLISSPTLHSAANSASSCSNSSSDLGRF